MENNEPNKIVNNLYKRYEKLHTDSGGDADKYDWKAEEKIKEELYRITNVGGAIEVMSKNCILKLVTLQSKLRFMQHHSFYIQFDKALNKI